MCDFAIYKTLKISNLYGVYRKNFRSENLAFRVVRRNFAVAKWRLE